MNSPITLIVPLALIPLVNALCYAIAVLRKFTSSLWLSGLGSVAGLTAGNYLDSTFGTPASVDGLDGGIKDAIGSNNATQPTTANKVILRRGVLNNCLASQDLTSPSWTSVGTPPTVTANAALAPDGTTTASRLVFSATGSVNRLAQNVGASGSVMSLSSIWLRGAVGGEVIYLWDGWSSNQGYTLSTNWVRYSTVPAATNSKNILLYAESGTPTAYAWGGQIEFGTTPGDYSPTTTTPASNPLAGKYWWELDGINDSFLTGNLALTNAFSIVVAGSFSSLPSQQTLIGEDTGGAQVYVTATGAIVLAKVGTGVLATTAAGEVAAGVPFVATATLAGGNAVIRKNGVQKVSTASAVTLSATTGARIGGTFAGAEFCVGSMSAVAVMQGVATDAEKLTVEKWAADLTPGGPTI